MDTQGLINRRFKMKITKTQLKQIIKEELMYDRDEEDFGPDPDDSYGEDPPELGSGPDLLYRGMKYSLPDEPGLRNAAEQEMERLIDAFFDTE